MGIEPTVRTLTRRTIGFEDQAQHQSRKHFREGVWQYTEVKIKGFEHLVCGGWQIAFSGLDESTSFGERRWELREKEVASEDRFAVEPGDWRILDV